MQAKTEFSPASFRLTLNRLPEILRADFLARFFGQSGRKIAFAGAASDGHDQLSLVLGTLRHLDRRENICAGRDADEQTFFLGQTTGRDQRVLVAYRDYFIDNLQVQIARDESRTGALDLVRTGLERLAL